MHDDVLLYCCKELRLHLFLQVLYKYSNGMYGLYPKTIGADGCLSFEAGVLLEDGCFWRYCARYHEDRSLDTIQWQRFAPGG